MQQLQFHIQSMQVYFNAFVYVLTSLPLFLVNVLKWLDVINENVDFDQGNLIIDWTFGQMVTLFQNAKYESFQERCCDLYLICFFVAMDEALHDFKDLHRSFCLHFEVWIRVRLER